MNKKYFLLLIIPVLLFPFQLFGAFVISPFNYEWCGSTFPTAYVNANFSITETTISGSLGFTKSQVNKTFIITIPANLEFKTTGTLASVTTNVINSPEVVIDSFKFNSANQFTVWITTSSINVDYNTIYFNNFEIRAVSAVTGAKITRGVSPNNGTFRIDNSYNNPTTTRPFGTISAKIPYVYTSSAVTQLLTTTNISQFSVNNPILRIAIRGNGGCGSQITKFVFSAAGTNGTDSLRNISQAKVYYSTSSSFTYATASLFGSVDSLTSMNFTITGTYNTNFTANTFIYFYLCYDVPGDAYTDSDGNRLDARLDSLVIDGVAKTSTTPNPPLGRIVVPSAYYYSIGSGNWYHSSLWSVTQGGPSCNCEPNGAGIVVIDSGHNVNMNKSRKVDVVNIMKDGVLSGQSAGVKFYAVTEVNVYDNGYFEFLGDMVVRGNLNIFGTGTSTFHKVDSVGGNLYIAPGATLMNFSSSTNELQVCGNVYVDGLLQNTGANIGFFNTTNIDGTGTIRTSFIEIKGGDKTVLSTANLFVDAGIKIKGNYMVDNFGKMNIRGNIDADSNASNWTNEQYSVLSYGGSANMFLTKGSLTASSKHNTVRYSGSSDQVVIYPENFIYHHLVLEGSGNKALQTDIHLHGDLTFNANLSHLQKTITVDGDTMQFFTGTTSPKLYGLTMSNSENGLTLELPVRYNGHLTLISGKIFTTMSNILIATDSATATSGSVISFVHGPMQKIGDDAFVYPVGKDTIWARIGITAPQTTAATFTAEYFNESYINTTSITPPLDHVSTVEYWNLLQSAKAGDSVMVTLYWESADRSYISDYSINLVVAGWSGTSWLTKGQSAITPSDPGNITSFFVNSFRQFTFGSLNEDNVLPISLLEYNAKPLNNIVTNFWSTVSEINNDYFTVERSTDAVNFESIGTVQGAGNSNKLIQYSFDDLNPYMGISYYRLKQTDFDGKFTYSNIVAVNFKESDNFSIYPSPFNSYINITLNGTSLPNNSEFKIFNTIGQEVVSTLINDQTTTIESINLPSGVYFYKIIANSIEIQTGKLVSQH